MSGKGQGERPISSSLSRCRHRLDCASVLWNRAEPTPSRESVMAGYSRELQDSDDSVKCGNRDKFDTVNLANKLDSLARYTR